ncbi:MAG: hypothetical protein MEQ84_07755 [Mesorhizobium sp.]|nr:hypothetical protein [Mesorhizobium sp.]
MADLTIVTTRPHRALLTLFGQPEPPQGVRVVDDIQSVGQIANGSRCFALWFEPRKFRSALEWAWIMRRERGGVVGLELADVERLGVFGSGSRVASIPPVTSIRAVGHEVRA